MNAEHLWFVMHQHRFNDPDTQSFAVTCYCDDSGSDEESKTAFIGGLLMNRFLFFDFNQRWAEMLREFRIDGIHMRDFVRTPPAMHPEMKWALFRTAAKIINESKIYSVAIGIPQADFKALLSMELYRKLLGPYALAFLTMVLLNREMAHTKNFNERIAYLVDKGKTVDQLNAAHTAIIEWEKNHRERSHTGSITFDCDENNYALQAADVIAWLAHRRCDFSIEGEFLALADILQKETTAPNRPHVEIIIPAEGISVFTGAIERWIGRNGNWPTLSQMMEETYRKPS